MIQQEIMLYKEPEKNVYTQTTPYFKYTDDEITEEIKACLAEGIGIGTKFKYKLSDIIYTIKEFGIDSTSVIAINGYPGIIKAKSDEGRILIGEGLIF